MEHQYITDDHRVLSVEAIDGLNERALQLLNVDVRQTIELATKALHHSERCNDAEPYLKGKGQALLALGAAAYRRNENQAAIRYSEQGLELCEFITDLKSMTFGLNTIGATWINLGEYDKALETHVRSLTIRESIQDEHGAATSLMNIGNVYYLLGEFASALDYYLRSLDMRQRIQDLSGIGTSLTNIANVYGSMGDYDQALEYLLKSADIKERTDNKQGLGQTLVDIANEYLRRCMNTIAMEYALRSYEISKDIGNKVAQGAALHTMAAIEEADGLNEHALNTYRRSYELRRSIAHHKGEIECQISVGKLLCRIGDADEADSVLRDALALAEDIKSRPLVFEACSALAQCCELQGNFKEALRHFKRFHTIKEELFNEESAQKTRNLHTLHKVQQARAESEIYRLRTVELSAANKEILRQQSALSHQAEELHAHNDALQQLVREKNELLAIVAHDLKNPLSGIVITTSNLQRNYNRMTSDDAAAQLVVIEKTAKRMKDIILKLLDLHAIESNKINLNPEFLNLCECVQHAVELYSQRAYEKGIALQVDVGHSAINVYADESALQQVVENLLSNAIKFSQPDSAIHIICSGAQGEAFLEIRDEGPGIADSERERLFKKFAKLSNQPTNGEESTGLGLSIVYQLCQVMNLQVRHRNREERGSVFSVHFEQPSRN